MLNTVWGTVRNGQIELLEHTDLQEGVRLLITILAEDEDEFWMRVSEPSLDAIWNNEEDDVYAQLLAK